jgi:replicative DNA helicase
MFLYREDRERPETENKNVVEVIVAKHRNGPVGTVGMYFDDKTTSFKDLEKYKSNE